MPIKIINSDITLLSVDAIVNAANETLLGGGGVDGAIHKAAGKELLEECILLKGCKTGEAKITKGYKLPSKYVIHTPGPIYKNGKSGEAKLLKSCYRKSLETALEFKCRSIAFPCISAGVYGYPIKDSAVIALETISSFLKETGENLDVYCVCFSKETETIYKKIFTSMFNSNPDVSKRNNPHKTCKYS